MDDRELSISRFNDLAQRAFNKNIWTYSEFLTLSQQSDLKSLKFPVNVTIYGGYEGAERQIAVFGNIDDIGYEPEYPVDIIKISPVNEKFSQELTHRDFLGSLMGAGIKREMLGDFIITGNSAYVFCFNTVTAYICDTVDFIKRTKVKCSVVQRLPENFSQTSVREEHIISSQRLDVIVCAVYNLSRNDAKKLFDVERVFINGRISENSSNIKNGDIVSVRGFGRFKFVEILRSTKKGKIVALTEKYV